MLLLLQHCRGCFLTRLVIILLLPFLLSAENYEEKFYKDSTHRVKGWGIHADVAYSSYLIELDSSEMNAAIDYDVLELTLGTSYTYEEYIFGAYTKVLLKELQSNMNVVTTQAPLADHANIEKKEFAFYMARMLKESKNSSWHLNAIYHYALLEALDNYRAFYNYESEFDYATQGVALSLVYSQKLSEEASWFVNTGLLYTQAEVKMSERINADSQDGFVNDKARALGLKLSLGYNHQLSEHLFVNFRTDAWKLNFGELEVTSSVGDTLPKAKLREQSFSNYLGFTWRF